jgi:hypothetical protein
VHHVLPGRPPSADTFSRLPGYRGFLQRTASLARSAECIADVEGAWAAQRLLATAFNQQQFWMS